MNYFTTADIEKMIRDFKYPYFKLYYRAHNSFDAFKLIIFHKPSKELTVPISDSNSKQNNKANEETINETIAAFHNALSIYENKPGYIFQIELKNSEKGDNYGPFIFSLDKPATQGLGNLNNNDQLQGGGGLYTLKDLIEYAVEKSNLVHDRDSLSQERTKFNEKKSELEKERADFEKEKIEPGAKIAGKGLLYAVDVIANEITDEKLNLSGMKVDRNKSNNSDGEVTPETQLASDIANYIVDKNLTVDQENQIFDFVKKYVSKLNEKTDGN